MVSHISYWTHVISFNLLNRPFTDETKIENYLSLGPWMESCNTCVPHYFLSKAHALSTTPCSQSVLRECTPWVTDILILHKQRAKLNWSLGFYNKLIGFHGFCYYRCVLNLVWTFLFSLVALVSCFLVASNI